MESRTLAFEAVSDPPGLEIIDRVEQLRYQLFTSNVVDPVAISTDDFVFPVGMGLRIETDSVGVPSDVSVVVRNEYGEMITDVEHLESESFDEGSYVIELSTQVKTYLQVEGPFDISSGFLETTAIFEQRQPVDVGFRSRHARPAATVTTTEDPVDIMRTITAFGSALKTTSPERSFPTLRGHPPQVELGDELQIPEGLEPPETGITIEVPPAYETIYPVATLAYYLGATVVPGQRPRLVTDDGFTYAFAYPAGYEQDVEQTLKQVFLLDCLVRTEGVYKLELQERKNLEPYLGFDWERLYNAPIAERIETYLSVPYELIADEVPEWRLSVHVEPTPETAKQLPFVVDDLAVIRTAETARTAASSMTGGVGEDVLTRSSSSTESGQQLLRSTAGISENVTFVQPEKTDALEQAWIGEHIPIGASKLTLEAFHNRLDREVTEGDISITIVVNDSRMDEERDLVNQAYGDRDDLPFDVTVKRDLTVAELRATLAEDRDFLHYIGHIDEDGFECTDGRLDAESVVGTNIDAFLLNACNSYRQGLELVSAGAIGGIVTLTDIINDRAINIGETIAGLLNAGFPLRAALTIAREEHIIGGQYIVVGDGGMTLTQAPSRTLILVNATVEKDWAMMDIQTFATDTADLGSIFTPYLETTRGYFLSSGKIGPFRTSTENLEAFFELEKLPVKINDGPLSWSTDITLNSF